MQKQVVFKDDEHKSFYNEKIMEYTKQGRVPDSYVKPMFYLLALSEETRNNFDSLYDMQSGSIKLDGLRGGWLTGTMKKLCLLAFNLYNGWTQDGRKRIAVELTPDQLFASDFARYFMQAIQLRHAGYFRTKEEE